MLGRRFNDIKAADKIVFTAIFIILFFALFEYFFLESFLKVFSIAEYYVARGTLQDADWAQNASQGLMVSGMRPTDQGRTLLSFLGNHRVSSIFLEPISLGNFGTLVTLWAVIRSRMEGRIYIWCILSGLALVILSDTRFAAYFLVLGVVLLMTPPQRVTPFIFLLPFTVIIALFLWGMLGGHYDGPTLEGSSVHDRLLYTGEILFNLNVFNWFGLEASGVQTMDSGYAYVISNVGIIGFAALWILFMSIEGSSRYYYSFRNAIAVYFAALACISASHFTIKIAALLWFLLGVLSAWRGKDRTCRTRVVPT